MIRDILAVITGFIIGNIVMMGLHYVGMIFYPLPEGTNMGDITAIAEYVKIAPLGALLMVMFAHLGGTFLAGLSTALVSKNINTAYIVGGVLYPCRNLQFICLTKPLVVQYRSYSLFASSHLWF